MLASRGCFIAFLAATGTFLTVANPVSAQCPPGDSNEAANAAVVQALERPVTVSMVQGNLRELCAELALQMGVPICLEELALAQATTDCLETLSLDVTKAGAKAVLETALSSVSRGRPSEVAIIIEPRGGALVITAKPGRPSSSTGRRVEVRGTVVSAAGTVLPNARVRLIGYRSSIYGQTDAQGEFVLPTDSSLFPSGTLLAVSDGQGGFEALQPIESQVVDPIKGLGRETIKLGAKKTIEVAVVNEAGTPVNAGRVGIVMGYAMLTADSTHADGRVRISVPADAKLDSVFAFKKGAGFDYRSFKTGRDFGDRQVTAPPQPGGEITLKLETPRTITLKVADENDRPLSGLEFYPWYVTKPSESSDHHLEWPMFHGRTNDQGEVTFDWLPAWEKQGFTLWPMAEGFEHTRTYVKVDELTAAPMPVKLRRLVEVSGRVTDTEGRPVSRAVIKASGASHGFDSGSGTAVTDDIGRYWMNLSPYQTYIVTAVSEDQSQASAAHEGLLTYPDKPVEGIDFTLRPATRVIGRVTVGPDRLPAQAQPVQVYQYGRDLNNRGDVGFPKPPKEAENRWVQPTQVQWKQTDADGRFEFLVGPGQFDVRGPEQVKVEKFEVIDQKELIFDFHSPRKEKGTFRGLVVAGDPPLPVPAEITGVIRHTSGGLNLVAKTDESGRFTLERKLHPTTLFAKSRDGKLAGIVEIGADDAEVTIAIAPTASYTARIVGPDQQPLAPDVQVIDGVRVYLGDRNSPFQWAFGRSQNADATGLVRFENLVVGATYEVHAQRKDENSYANVTKVTPEKPGVFDLGTLTIKPRPAPYKPPTLAERIAQAFEKNTTALERHAVVQSDIALSHQHELVIFADPNSRFAAPLYEKVLDQPVVRRALYDFRTLSIPLGGSKHDQARELAAKLGVELPNESSPLIVVVDGQGKVVAQLRFAEISETPLDAMELKVDADKIIAFATQHALPPLDAKVVLASALEKARIENKRVFLQQTATWCGPCWSLSRFLNRTRDVWEKDFIWIKMDERWTNHDDVMSPIRNGASGGIPWVAILDAEGKVLATSNGPDGQNYGFPTEPDEIKHFVGMLKSTGARLTEDDAQSLIQELTSPMK